MPRCRVPECKVKQAIFNLPGETIGICCSIHKEESMIDIKHKKCIYDNCNIRPIYNLPNEKIAIYCANHKLKNMINIIDKKCKSEGCKIIPNYNFANEKNGIYCLQHKLDNMIDVVHKKCEFNGCIKRAYYNFENEKIPLYCLEHKFKNMIDIVNRRCLTFLCQTFVTKKYRGYCLRCFMNIFPNEPVSRNYKIKEKQVFDFVNLHFERYIESYDKQISGGCSNKRPDIFMDLFTHSIIIEIDENQHSDYSCENKRMMLIFRDLGERPIVFIRFNPDKYIDKNGKTVKSCFIYHKTSGIPIIYDKNSWHFRLEKLKIIIEKYIVIIPEKEVSLESLFFNEI